MINASEQLIKLGAPSNILTRTLYVAGFYSAYFPLKYGILTAAFVTRKDPLELLRKVTDKLDITPTK